MTREHADELRAESYDVVTSTATTRTGRFKREVTITGSDLYELATVWISARHLEWSNDDWKARAEKALGVFPGQHCITCRGYVEESETPKLETRKRRRRIKERQ